MLPPIRMTVFVPRLKNIWNQAIHTFKEAHRKLPSTSEIFGIFPLSVLYHRYIHLLLIACIVTAVTLLASSLITAEIMGII